MVGDTSGQSTVCAVTYCRSSFPYLPFSTGPSYLWNANHLISVATNAMQVGGAVSSCLSKHFHVFPEEEGEEEAEGETEEGLY